MKPIVSDMASHSPGSGPVPHPPIAPLPGVMPASSFRSGISVSRFYVIHLQGALLPVTAGLFLYGWRAFAVMLLVVASAACGVFIWRRIGRRGGQLHYASCLWMALLLALLLPAHLATSSQVAEGGAGPLWALLPAAGLLLVILTWVLGGLGAGRLHPVVLAYLLLAALFAQHLVPHSVLQREHAFFGDVLDTAQLPQPHRAQEVWIHAESLPPYQAIRSEPAAAQLTYFTSFFDPPDRTWLSLEALIRDRLPPLENLVIGGQPAPIGAGSAVAVIVGGLFLIYRGLIDFRIPLVLCVVAFVCFLVLPIPVVMTETAREWRWLIMRETGVGPAMAITFANYQLLASPLLLVAFFLATDSAVAPISRRGCAVFAALLGIAVALFQLYVSVSLGPYLALLLVSLVTPALDKRFRPYPLV